MLSDHSTHRIGHYDKVARAEAQGFTQWFAPDKETPMHLELLTLNGVEFILRWIHFMAGITWIGLLYYFNFVQTPFFAETEAPVRTGAIVKLVPRALWWFRWGAMFTFLSGITIILIEVGKGGTGVLGTSWGTAIQTGALMGTIMFLNVWLIIWPKQKIIIASTETVSKGGQADPKAAAAAGPAFLASRTNTLFSIPMLFFMGAARHLNLFEDTKSPMVPGGIAVLLIAAVEANALFGKKGAGPSKLLDSHITVIHVGIAFALILYLLYALL
jgi:uncharacterized membrane protein